MSYILDALRKADAERESGAVPDLHAQQYVTMPAEDEPRGHGWLIALAGMLAAALLGVLGWVWLGGESPRERVVAAVTPANAPVTVVAPVGAPVVVQTLPSTPPVASPSIPPDPAAATPSPTSQLKPSPRSPAALTPTPKADTPRAAKARSPASTPSTEPAAFPTGSAPASTRLPAKPGTPLKSDGAATANRIYQTSDLPEAIRRELPPVSINGSSYAADAGSRVLIANGQVLHEGDTVAPGLQLEKIGRRSATLAFKGYRYELTY